MQRHRGGAVRGPSPFHLRARGSEDVQTPGMAVRRREHRRGHAAVRRRRNARNAAVFFAVVVARRVHRRAGGDEPYERTSGWSSKASEAELKGVE
eukprot:17170-Pelagococcus_subviridis.AAC.1